MAGVMQFAEHVAPQVASGKQPYQVADSDAAPVSDTMGLDERVAAPSAAAAAPAGDEVDGKEQLLQEREWDRHYSKVARRDLPPATLAKHPSLQEMANAYPAPKTAGPGLNLAGGAALANPVEGAQANTLEGEDAVDSCEVPSHSQNLWGQTHASGLKAANNWTDKVLTGRQEEPRTAGMPASPLTVIAGPIGSAVLPTAGGLTSTAADETQAAQDAPSARKSGFRTAGHSTLHVVPGAHKSTVVGTEFDNSKGIDDLSEGSGSGAGLKDKLREVLIEMPKVLIGRRKGRKHREHAGPGNHAVSSAVYSTDANPTATAADASQPSSCYAEASGEHSRSAENQRRCYNHHRRRSSGSWSSSGSGGGSDPAAVGCGVQVWTRDEHQAQHAQHEAEREAARHEHQVNKQFHRFEKQLSNVQKHTIAQVEAESAAAIAAAHMQTTRMELDEKRAARAAAEDSRDVSSNVASRDSTINSISVIDFSDVSDGSNLLPEYDDKKPPGATPVIIETEVLPMTGVVTAACMAVPAATSAMRHATEPMEDAGYAAVGSTSRADISASSAIAPGAGAVDGGIRGGRATVAADVNTFASGAGFSPSPGESAFQPNSSGVGGAVAAIQRIVTTASAAAGAGGAVPSTPANTPSSSFAVTSAKGTSSRRTDADPGPTFTGRVLAKDSISGGVPAKAESPLARPTGVHPHHQMGDELQQQSDRSFWQQNSGLAAEVPITPANSTVSSSPIIGFDAERYSNSSSTTKQGSASGNVVDRMKHVLSKPKEAMQEAAYRRYERDAERQAYAEAVTAGVPAGALTFTKQSDTFPGVPTAAAPAGHSDSRQERKPVSAAVMGSAGERLAEDKATLHHQVPSDREIRQAEREIKQAEREFHREAKKAEREAQRGMKAAEKAHQAAVSASTEERLATDCHNRMAGAALSETEVKAQRAELSREAELTELRQEMQVPYGKKVENPTETEFVDKSVFVADPGYGNAEGSDNQEGLHGLS